MAGVVITVLILIVLMGCVVASLFVRRHRESLRPDAAWRPTDEIFNDPSTNRVMRVWVDARGERHYVPEKDQPAT